MLVADVWHCRKWFHIFISIEINTYEGAIPETQSAGLKHSALWDILTLSSVEVVLVNRCHSKTGTEAGICTYHRKTVALMLSAYMLDISVTSQDLWFVSAPCCERGSQTGMFTLLSVGFSRVWVHHRCNMHSYWLVKWVWGHSQAQGMLYTMLRYVFAVKIEHIISRSIAFDLKLFIIVFFEPKMWYFKKPLQKPKYHSLWTPN